VQLYLPDEFASGAADVSPQQPVDHRGAETVCRQSLHEERRALIVRADIAIPMSATSFRNRGTVSRRRWCATRVSTSKILSFTGRPAFRQYRADNLFGSYPGGADDPGAPNAARPLPKARNRLAAAPSSPANNALLLAERK
jgi:hypothetical protein